MDSQQEPWRQQPVPQMTNSWYLRSRMVVKDLSRPKLFGIWLPSLAEDAQQPFGKENCTSRYPFFFPLTAESNQKKHTKVSSFNSLKFPNNFNTSPSLTVPTFPLHPWCPRRPPIAANCLVLRRMRPWECSTSRRQHLAERFQVTRKHHWLKQTKLDIFVCWWLVHQPIWKKICSSKRVHLPQINKGENEKYV